MTATLADFAALKEAVAGWLDRSDLEERIPTFVGLFEAEANRRLRALDMLCRAEAQTDKHYTDLPENWLAARSIELASGVPRPRKLIYRVPDDMVNLRAGDTGDPRFYSIIGRTLELAPIPPGLVTVSLLYWERLTPLEAANSSNWLLLKHPDLYLYGTLVQASGFLKNDARVQSWRTWAEACFAMIGDSERDAEVSGGARATPQSFRIG